MGLSNLNAATKKVLVIVVVVIAAGGIGWYTYHRYRVAQEQKYPKFYSGNGRLEATEVYVSAKIAGRIDQIFIKEGDLVRKGDKLVQMQTDTLEAERDATKAQIEIYKGELAMAEATAQQKQIALDGAEREYKRQKQMLASKATSQQHYDNAETAYLSAKANLDYAKANVVSSKAQIDKQQAELRKIEADINDSLLIAKYDGRVQNLLAHEGEVLSSGGRVMNIIALTDVYMTFFLPTSIVGKVELGAEVKLIFDAAPDFPIDAKVTFIDPVAQFTPKSVETQVEREKLMFRIKASIDPKRLEEHLELVKTGVPGVAWVKLAPGAKWEECPAKINLNVEELKKEIEKRNGGQVKNSTAPAAPPQKVKVPHKEGEKPAPKSTAPAAKAAKSEKKVSPAPANQQK